jgi:hypothetical protein
VKHENVVLRRLDKLHFRYAKQHIKRAQNRAFTNCSYNYQHKGESHYCTYKAGNPGAWPGLVCEDDGIARSCKWFKPKVSTEDAKNEYLLLMKADDYVYKTYPDIAVLQWVLNDRIYKYGFSWVQKFVLWFYIMLLKVSFRLRPRQRELHDPAEIDDNDEAIMNGLAIESIGCVKNDPPANT